MEINISSFDYDFCILCPPENILMFSFSIKGKLQIKMV